MQANSPLPSTGSPKPVPPSPAFFSSHPIHTSLASAANLANLLPTGTVLAFRTLAPSFSNKGSCRLPNKYLTSCLVAFCSVACFLSTFIDSVRDCDGRLFYGIATFKGLHVFHRDYDGRRAVDSEAMNVDGLSRFRIGLIDFVHGFVSLLVFLVFAFSDSEVQRCFFPRGGDDLDVLVMNLPLASGVLSSFLFVIFPSSRRGVGFPSPNPGIKALNGHVHV